MQRDHSIIDNFGRITSGNYFLYIVTNKSRTSLYIGVTNNLKIRIQQHINNAGNPSTFAGKYNCNLLIYWERFDRMIHAINREKQIKKWNRRKKEELINDFNPHWRVLNSDLETD